MNQRIIFRKNRSVYKPKDSSHKDISDWTYDLGASVMNLLSVIQNRKRLLGSIWDSGDGTTGVIDMVNHYVDLISF